MTRDHGTELHHVGVGRAHRVRHIIVLVADLRIRVVSQEGELLRRLTLDPTHDNQPTGIPGHENNKTPEPDGSRASHVLLDHKRVGGGT